MASTRSKNTPGNYCLEQRAYTQGSSYVAERDYAYPKHVLMAGTGLLQGYMGNAVLAENPQDVESFLFGIGATNLVDPATQPFAAHLVEHPAYTIVDQRVPLVMPETLHVEPHQRQYPMPSGPLVVRK
jgi:hypothetical protein